MKTQGAERAPSRLEDISTEWAIVRDPARFVIRYSRAIRNYLRALVPSSHNAEEVAQEFFLRVTQHGFFHTRESGGRFRDYLKTAVRNAALNFLQRQRSLSPTGPAALAGVPDKTQVGADQAWVAEWRQCLLSRACHALERHQDQSPGNLFHTVLTMVVDNPLDDMKTLADRTSALIGRPLQAEAFRKQISRARRMLARLLVQEVAQTLHNPTPEQIKEELIELAFWEYVRGFVSERCRNPCRKSNST
jgi:hypothetical protein